MTIWIRTMDELLARLRCGLDNVDGGELGGLVLLMNEAADEIESLRARLEKAEAERGWQPIETAPTVDLGKALIFDDGESVVGEYLAGAGEWVDENLNTLDMATHWHPLPDSQPLKSQPDPTMPGAS